MPYAPGVQDISGQLRAQGIAQAGQAWSQAIGNIGKSVTDAFQTYKQNQFLTNQALGKFTAATQADPSLLKFLESGGQQEDPNAPKFPVSPELLKSWSKVKEGKPLDVRDAAMLGTMADTWVKTKQDAMQIQHINLQNKLLTQQAEQNQRMADFMKRYTTASAATGTPTDGKAAPEGIGQFAGGAGGGGIKPPTEEDVVAKAIATTGKMPTQAQITAQLRQDLQEWRKGQIESKEYASPDVAAAAAKDAVSKGVYPEGTIPIVKKNAQTGTYYLETTTSSVEPAEVSARRKRLEATAELDAKDADAYIRQVQKEGAGAMDDTFINQEIRKALNSKVETGPVEAFKQNVRKITIGAGLADQETIDKANRFDELEGLMMRGQLEFAQNFTRGNLNTFEQKLVESAVQNASAKLPGANAYLNDVVEAIKQKKADHALAEKEFRKQYKDKVERAQALRDWELDPANSVNRRFQQLRAGFDASAKSSEKALTVQTNPDGTVSASTAPKYTPGTRAKQGEKTYEFDGTNWNEVK